MGLPEPTDTRLAHVEDIIELVRLKSVQHSELLSSLEIVELYILISRNVRRALFSLTSGGDSSEYCDFGTTAYISKATNSVHNT